MASSRSKSRLTGLDAFIKVVSPSLGETDWSIGTYIALVRHKISNIGFLGHFSTAVNGDATDAQAPLNAALMRYVARARRELGLHVEIVLRGGALIVAPGEDEEVREAFEALANADRRRLLLLFSQYGYQQDQVDAKWSDINYSVQLTYDAKRGSWLAPSREIPAQDISEITGVEEGMDEEPHRNGDEG